ncbi:MAG TPA: acetyl-CoA decarbonylase/synthase complex subunit gamma [Dehalococcoidia bacterium]|nr:acetyl-CoA decarbonylase/synthase complex subunit gamma [Dehalococcoidia bacterium]
MALTGIEIYKHLPKTNCKDCGFPTCLAFAMRLAQKGAELSACPHLSPEAREVLAAASRPLIRPVTVGSGERAIKLGNETVLFRHEKTFYNPPGLVVRLKDTAPLQEARETARRVAEYRLERAGATLALDGLALENASGDEGAFLALLEAVGKDLPLVLMSESPAVIEAALKEAGTARPLVYGATWQNAQEMARLAKEYACPLAVKADGVEDLACLVELVTKAGAEDVVLDPGARSLPASLADFTTLRRLAIAHKYAALGYPIIAFPGRDAILAGQHIAKYAGLIVLDGFDEATAYALLTLRMNIYTDPQKPVQVEPGLYPIGAPKETSPLMVTTNFSLTYFSVAGEVESSGLPAWLLIAETDGLSVLTAWAAGKFDGATIAKAVKADGVAGKLAHRRLIIPGLVSVLAPELEEELPDWEIRIGPREAVDLGNYLRRTWNH